MRRMSPSNGCLEDLDIGEYLGAAAVDNPALYLVVLRPDVVSMGVRSAEALRLL